MNKASKKTKEKRQNKVCSAIKNLHHSLEEPLRIYWYVAVLIFLTIYVIVNRYVVANFIFFDDFNGMNLLFVIWVAMLVLPCLGSLEILGVKYKGFARKCENIAKWVAETGNNIDDVKAEYEKMTQGGKEGEE